MHTEKINFTETEVTEITDVFSRLYGNSDGFVKIMSTGSHRGYFYNREALSDETKVAAIMNSHRFDKENLYASTAAYRTMQKATSENILTVNALCVDADFSLRKGQEDVPIYDAIRALKLAVLDGMPEPSYVEYSRNLRLVYVLDGPYVIPKAKQKAESCKTFLKRVVQCLSEELNRHNEIIDFNATPQRLTSFIRIPYSVNKRTFGHYDFREEKYIIDAVNLYDVRIEWLHGKWDIDKLGGSVLPPLFDGYEDWKQRNRQNRKSSASGAVPQSVTDRRLKELEELQKRGYDVGYREKLCYFYWVTAMQKGQTNEEAKASVLAFNSHFKTPLEEHRLLTDCRLSGYIDGRTGRRCEGWERHFKDATIRESLGLGTNEEADLFGGRGMSNAEKCKRYYNNKINGNTKKKQLEQRMTEVQRMRGSGMKWKDIAEALGISERSAMRLGERLKQSGGHME